MDVDYYFVAIVLLVLFCFFIQNRIKVRNLVLTHLLYNHFKNKTIV